MNPLQLMRKVFRRRVYEVPRETYFRLLKEKDRDELANFVDILASELSRQGSDSAILAVGSSTFPQEYWNDQRVHPTYRDIDLRIIPEKTAHIQRLRAIIGGVLSTQNYLWNAYSATSMGNFCKPKKEHPFAFHGEEYGVNSITTKLRNRRSIDIILGKYDEETTANKHLAKERASNYAFSLLHSRDLN